MRAHTHVHAHTVTAATGNSCEGNWKASSTVCETEKRKGTASLGRTCEDQRLIKRKRDARKEEAANSIYNPCCAFGIGHVLESSVLLQSDDCHFFFNPLWNIFKILYACVYTTNDKKRWMNNRFYYIHVCVCVNSILYYFTIVKFDRIERKIK